MPRHALALALFAFLVSAARAAAPPSITQWVAVVAPDLADAVEPLAKARRDQGMRVVVLKTTDVLTEKQIRASDAAKLRDRVHALCRTHPGPSHVLLVGAVDSLFANRIVPPCAGTVGRMKGQPSDAPYGCPKGGRLPTVAVGRFPARNAEEAERMVAKTLALESAGRKPGAWKRRLTVLAGIPAYNPLVDRLVEAMAMSRFDRIHPAWTGRAVYTNPLSRFCLPAGSLKAKSLAYLGEGQAFTLYLGHSSAEGLYAGRDSAFLDRGDWGKAELPHGGGVFVTFGCNGCQLSGEDGEGYGLWAIRNASGPAAVLGSHAVCFAAMVNLAADGLFRKAFQTATPSRLALAWLALLEGVATGKMDFLSYRALDGVDGDSRIPQATQRQEHLEMFVLLGDPALRLPVADEIALDVPGAITPGGKLKVRGTLPEGMADARVEVALERPPSSSPADLAPLPRKPGKERGRVMLANHEKANRFALVTKSAAAKGRSFAAELDVPATLPATSCILRVYAHTKRADALAARRLEVRKDH